jgi:hypothetical protein
MYEILQSLKAYYRNQRILNIEFIRAQGYYCWGKETFSDQREYGKFGFTPIWPKFLIHLAILLFLGILVNVFSTVFLNGAGFLLSFIAGYLSVEINDYIWLRHYKKIQTLLSQAFQLLMILFLLAIAIIYLQGSGEGTLGKYLINWHQKINQDLHRNAQTLRLIDGKTKGENWIFILNPNRQPELFNASEAQKVCRDRLGANWRLPTRGELKNLQPHPALSETIRTWATGDQAGSLIPTQLGQSRLQSGNSFVSYQANDVYITLCHKEKQ